MPPKENKKSKKEKEKLEKLIASHQNERQEQEIEEDKQRQWVELTERMERSELLLSFYETLVNPAARLMVLTTTYDGLRRKMQQEGAVSADRVLSMQVEMRRMEKSRKLLQLELVHLRGEVRALDVAVASKLDNIVANVDVTLNAYVEALDRTIWKDRREVEESAHLLNHALEQARLDTIELARKAQDRAAKITTLWQENTSMHTRIPPRIRNKLASLDKSDLLLILDALSFEDVVFKTLLYRFPPDQDAPL